MKTLIKAGVRGVCLLLVMPAAVLTAFGRVKPVYSFFAQMFSLLPGIPGDYLRIAFYKWTLSKCSLSSRIQFGSFFAHPEAQVGPHVYIGSYCVLGRAIIGDGAQIASCVQILSGSHQHARREDGRISGAEEGIFTAVEVGADSWIGAGAIVMADVGKGSTIGAGSVVSRPIPAGSVAVGSPARVIKPSVEQIRPAVPATAA